MKKIGLIAIFISCLIALAAIFSFINFQKQGPEVNTKIIKLADDTNATAESVNTLVDSLNDFSFNFYQQIKLKEKTGD